MRFGILDLGERVSGNTKAAHLGYLMESAIAAEECGYRRFWLGEHHADASSWASPTVVVGAIAARTTRMNVGAAGMLLRFQNPYTVCTDYSSLVDLFGNRIDLGLAAGLPTNTAIRDFFSWAYPTGAATFQQRLSTLIGLLTGRLVDERGAVRSTEIPALAVPRLWLLGKSISAAQRAGALGLNYAHSLFHDGAEDAASAVDAFRSQNASSTKLTIVVSAAIATGDTLAQAEAIIAKHANAAIKPNLIGNYESVAMRLRELAGAADEVVFYDLDHDPCRKIRTIRVLSEMLNAPFKSLPIARP